MGHHLEQTTHSKPTCEGDATEAGGDFVHPRLQSQVSKRKSFNTGRHGENHREALLPTARGGREGPTEVLLLTWALEKE